MINDIYNECPTYKNNLITLKQTSLEDTEELLECYSDEKAVPFFNSDNCNGDNFYYTSTERMKKAIEFWDYSYKNKYFVRWTVVLNNINEKIGTIEMFHRHANDEFNHYGVLRIDLKSKYEKQEILDEILKIVNAEFYQAFNVEFILTKAISEANERISSLENNGYIPLNKKLMIYDDYFVKSKYERNI